LSWGTGDFCGGLASRYSSVLAAILASQSVGFGATLLLLASSAEHPPAAAPLAWAAGAGLCGLVGLGAFYRALARGTMGLIAPLAALLGAGLPAIVGLVTGEPLSLPRTAGLGIALIAVVLISLPGGERTPAERSAVRVDIAELPLVLLSGLGFAGFYLFLDRATAEGGGIWWSLLVVRLVGLVLVLLVTGWLMSRAAGLPLRGRAGQVFGLGAMRAASIGAATMLPLLLLAGAGDLGGNAFFVLANEQDSLPVAVVLSSLYPVVTTVLAAVFLRERLRGRQLGGIALAVIGVVLISAGDELQPLVLDG
jgi:drug/metabolite transporter (DMT)-like permease